MLSNSDTRRRCHKGTCCRHIKFINTRTTCTAGINQASVIDMHVRGEFTHDFRRTNNLEYRGGEVL